MFIFQLAIIVFIVFAAVYVRKELNRIESKLDVVSKRLSSDISVANTSLTRLSNDTRYLRDIRNDTEEAILCLSYLGISGKTVTEEFEKEICNGNHKMKEVLRYHCIGTRDMRRFFDAKYNLR